MSRTYRKNIRVGICCGDNRSYYKLRRRKRRVLGKQNLRELLSNKPLDEVEELILNVKMPKKDTWDEPTDGCIVYNKDNINKPSKGWFNKEFRNKLSRLLKPKHKRKHSVELFN